MEKNYVSMLREVEKLRTALANSSGSDRRAGMVFPSFFFFFVQSSLFLSGLVEDLSGLGQCRRAVWDQRGVPGE